MKIKTKDFKHIYNEVDSIDNVLCILLEYCKKEKEILEVNMIKALVECVQNRSGKLVIKFLDDYEKYI